MLLLVSSLTSSGHIAAARNRHTNTFHKSEETTHTRTVWTLMKTPTGAQRTGWSGKWFSGLGSINTQQSRRQAQETHAEPSSPHTQPVFFKRVAGHRGSSRTQTMGAERTAIVWRQNRGLLGLCPHRWAWSAYKDHDTSTSVVAQAARLQHILKSHSIFKS